MSEGDSGSSRASDEEEVLMFQCKKCGKLVPAAEKDAHRDMHRREKTAKRPRTSSPQPSEGTIFVPQATKSTPKKGGKKVGRPGGPKGRKGGKGKGRKSIRKRESVKKYDESVEWEKLKSG